MAKLKKLDIKNYPLNAAKNVRWARLLIRTFISAGLAFALIFTTIKAGYETKGLIFCIIGIIFICCYFLLNLAAIILKIVLKDKLEKMRKEDEKNKE